MIKIRTNPLGFNAVEEHYQHIDGKLVKHRTDGPAAIYRHSNGSVWIECWYQNDKRHRPDGPSFTSFYEDGRIKEMRWQSNGVSHRTDGPASIYFSENGNNIETYYIDGEYLNEEQVAIMKKRVELEKAIDAIL